MPGGVVVRINNAEIRTEWLTPDGTWSADADDALFFARYDGEGIDTAAAVAESLRKELRQHVFPAVRTKPMPFRTTAELIECSLCHTFHIGLDECPAQSVARSTAPAAQKRRRPKQRKRAGVKPQTAPAIRAGSRVSKSAPPTDAERFWWKNGAMA